MGAPESDFVFERENTRPHTICVVCKEQFQQNSDRQHLCKECDNKKNKKVSYQLFLQINHNLMLVTQLFDQLVIDKKISFPEHSSIFEDLLDIAVRLENEPDYLDEDTNHDKVRYDFATPILLSKFPYRPETDIVLYSTEFDEVEPPL